jgi:hypothetical protein
VDDFYRRPNDNNSIVRGVGSLLNQNQNTKRKVERDHRMAYICREEGSKSADFSWKLSFEGQKVKRAFISLGEFSFWTSGKAMATICGGDLCTMLEKNGEVELTELNGAEYLEISVNLRGGQGTEDWQHAQLFRTPLAEPRANMRIELDFE